jgi:hypothetical protein
VSQLRCCRLRRVAQYVTSHGPLCAWSSNRRAQRNNCVEFECLGNYATELDDRSSRLRRPDRDGCEVDQRLVRNVCGSANVLRQKVRRGMKITAHAGCTGIGGIRGRRRITVRYRLRRPHPAIRCRRPFPPAGTHATRKARRRSQRLFLPGQFVFLSLFEYFNRAGITGQTVCGERRRAAFSGNWRSMRV